MLFVNTNPVPHCAHICGYSEARENEIFGPSPAYDSHFRRAEGYLAGLFIIKSASGFSNFRFSITIFATGADLIIKRPEK